MSRSSSSPSSTTQYLLGDLFETDGSGTITASYTDGPAGDLTSYNGPPTSSSTASFLYYDAHGNLAAEADNTPTQTGDHTYDPFGAPTGSVPTNTTVHRFVGRWNKQYDTASGLVLMGARPYDPNTGRFLAVDPIPGGSLNNYDYAGQDPINNFDLNGTMTTAKGGVGVVCGDGEIFLGFQYQCVRMSQEAISTPLKAVLETSFEVLSRTRGSWQALSARLLRSAGSARTWLIANLPRIRDAYAAAKDTYDTLEGVPSETLKVARSAVEFLKVWKYWP